MPRYDERSGPTRLYVGHISSRTRTRDLEDLFSKYGRVREVDMKQDFAFVNFSDSRDADEARHFLNGRTFDGSRMIVEFARGGPRGGRGGGGSSRDSRDYASSRGPPPGTGRCYNCGLDGHWARDCKAGDWKNKCYRCGQRGHIERNCRSSPSGAGSNRRHRSRSRSRSRSPAAVHRSSQSRSYDHSRSTSPRGADRSPVGEEQPERVHSASQSRSPTPRRGAQSRSPSPFVNGRSPVAEESPQRGNGSASPSPARGEEDDHDGSPMKDNASPTHSGGE